MSWVRATTAVTSSLFNHALSSHVTSRHVSCVKPCHVTIFHTTSRQKGPFRHETSHLPLSCVDMPCDWTSCHAILHLISSRTIPYHVTTYHVTFDRYNACSWHVMSSPVQSCCVITCVKKKTCQVACRHEMSCVVMSQNVTSSLAVRCHVTTKESRDIPCNTLPCHPDVISQHMTSQICHAGQCHDKHSDALSCNTLSHHVLSSRVKRWYDATLHVPLCQVRINSAMSCRGAPSCALTGRIECRGVPHTIMSCHVVLTSLRCHVISCGPMSSCDLSSQIIAHPAP